MIRELVRDQPFGRIRIWVEPDRPHGADRAPVIVEYAGLIGDPSTYALVGGTLIEGETQIDVPPDGAAFAGSLARGDRAAYGLPAEYRPAIFAAVPHGLAVSTAAHAAASSSPLVFGAVARLLVTLLRHGIEADEDVWTTYDDARRARSAIAPPGDIPEH